MHEPIEVLGAMITPAVLISAAALLLLSTAARLGRVNDRLQNLMTDTERLLSQDGSTFAAKQKRCLNLEQLTGLRSRLLHLRYAVTALYVTIALLIVTSILDGMYVLIPQITSMVPIAAGMFGASAFLYSIVHLIREASVAENVTLQEIDYVGELLRRLEHG